MHEGCGGGGRGGGHTQSVERELKPLLVEEDLSFPPHSYSAGGFLMRSCLGSGWKLEAAPLPPPPGGEAGEWEWFEEPPSWKWFQGPGCLRVPQPALLLVPHRWVCRFVCQDSAVSTPQKRLPSSGQGDKMLIRLFLAFSACRLLACFSTASILPPFSLPQRDWEVTGP